MLNGLDLFSGIGGITLALSEWVRPVAYCEIEPYAAGVVFSRIADGTLPFAPIFPDVTKLSGDILPDIDIIYGGFPCQDVSVAGLRKGLEGERTGLFSEIVRLAGECRPTFVFLENVPGIKPHRQKIFSAFENLGYTCRDGALAAAHVGALHIRNRWFFLAYSDSQHRGPEWDGPDSKGREVSAQFKGRSITDAASTISERDRQEQKRSQSRFAKKGWRPTQPAVCRRDDGVSNRVDRIKCLGNAVVPAQAKEAFKRLMGL
jgi:DNA (cytosine-5)-methyltransferase 1